MVRLAPKLVEQGYLVVRMNLRNAGAALGLSQKTYHAGLTTDVRAVQKWLSEKFAPGQITGIGFSLGGNLLLMTAAEDAIQKRSGLTRLMVVSPAVDLESASRKLSTYPGKWVANFFIDQLLRDMDYLKTVHPELQRLKFPKKMSIREFDDVHTSGIHGFRDAGDYYEQCSSLRHLSKIEIPTLILGSKDDPVVDLEGLAGLSLPSNIDLILTEHGGHVGYLGFGARPTQMRWSDDVLLNWLQRNAHSAQQRTY
jgi:predicted alpha/beta-fold hydrolase